MLHHLYGLLTTGIPITAFKAIINLGWDAVPFLIRDLEQKKRFWFFALNAITGIRPFDPGDITSYRRMTEAWIHWGKMKGMI